MLTLSKTYLAHFQDLPGGVYPYASYRNTAAAAAAAARISHKCAICKIARLQRRRPLLILNRHQTPLDHAAFSVQFN